ncbi:hypothetical protein [Curtobacterium sp. MCSS17_015]|uniref:hypothetical protein n=1 Tax=Curtobacterium sp. MCSS17_015 TaxID=2175666 RepID=UPI000DA938D8|nr:hypothetical protein [Curtobacterium sp. MCSS17_015]WIB25795.1 hypothetical protein DEJ18_12155 [Curtobacterium sp. MCSS17_015]
MPNKRYRAVVRTADGRQMFGYLTDLASAGEEITGTFTEEGHQWYPARDDYLTLGDALRSLDGWPDEDGKDNALVKGQDVFDLLTHRGVLGSGVRKTAPND